MRCNPMRVFLSHRSGRALSVQNGIWLATRRPEHFCGADLSRGLKGLRRGLRLERCAIPPSWLLAGGDDSDEHLLPCRPSLLPLCASASTSATIQGIGIAVVKEQSPPCHPLRPWSVGGTNWPPEAKTRLETQAVSNPFLLAPDSKLASTSSKLRAGSRFAAVALSSHDARLLGRWMVRAARFVCNVGMPVADEPTSCRRE
ncbi:hypothetical protein PG999_000018 [Apiospora kogelbergensis]|uniref:Uncharacterized protein n=1 Tax=Apiospora kogelbergensis TaxID=1337665 RepID=A0AAW0RAA1_9PEZI